MKKKIIVGFLVALMLVFGACAHSPVKSNVVMEFAQDVDRILMVVMQTAYQPILDMKGQPKYKAIAKTYNDTLKLVKKYDRMVIVMEETGNVLPIDKIMQMVHIVYHTLTDLENMGVNVTAAKKKLTDTFGEEL